jgi:hypothetical protein
VVVVGQNEVTLTKEASQIRISEDGCFVRLFTLVQSDCELVSDYPRLNFIISLLEMTCTPLLGLSA